MLSTDFTFHTPTDLQEAVRLLDEQGPGAKVLSGGMSMVPTINLGLLQPGSIVSLNHVAGLDRIEEDGGALRIGGMVRHVRIAGDPLVRRFAPILAEAATGIGDVQVRNRGTIGGSVAHADPAADYLPVLVVLDATVTLASAAGRRTVPVREFFVDVMMTALEPGEILVELTVPKLPERAGAAYVRLTRVEGSFALVNAAAVVLDGRCAVAIGAAVPTPALVELEFNSQSDPEEALARVGDAAFEACADASGDLNGSAEYRRAMACVYARRAVERALEQRR